MIDQLFFTSCSVIVASWLRTSMFLCGSESKSLLLVVVVVVVVLAANRWRH